MIRKLLALLLLALLLIILGVTVLLTTSLGATAVVKVSSHFVPGELTVSQVKGHLISHVQLKHIHYSQDNVTVRVQKSDVKWSFWALLHGRLEVKHLRVKGVVIHQAGGNSETGTESSPGSSFYPHIPKLEDVQLPFAILVDRLDLAQVHWHLSTMTWSLDRGHGQMKALPKGDVNLKLNWHQIRWMTPKVAPLLTVTKSRIRLSGDLHNYQVQLQGQIHQYSQDVTMAVEGQAQGDLRHVDLKQFKVATLDGELNLQGHVTWASQLSWQYHVKANHLNASDSISGTLKQVGFDLETSGSWSQSSHLTGHLSMNDMSGRLNQQPLTGHLDLAYKSGALTVKQAKVEVGDNQLQAKGELGERYHFHWNLKVSKLADVWSDLHGRVNSQGYIKGTWQKPQLHGEVQAHQIVYDKWHLHLGDAQAKIDWPQHTHMTLHLHHIIAPNDLSVDDIHLTARGSAFSHRLNVTVKDDWGKTRAQINGHYGHNQWQGLLTKWHIQSDQLGSWQLVKPSLIRVNSKVGVSPLIMHSSTLGTMQVKGQWQDQQHWQLATQIDDFNIHFLKQWLPYKIKRIHSDISAHGQLINDGQVTGHLRVAIQQALLDYPNTKDVEFRVHDSHIKADLNTKSGLTAEGVLKGQKPNWHTQFHASLPDFKGRSWPQQTDRVNVQAKGHMPELDFLNDIVPQARQIKGNLNYHFKAGGTWGQPQLTGKAQLQDGQVNIVPLGVDFQKIRFDLSASHESFQLHGKLNSSGQTLTVNGYGDWRDLACPRAVVNIQGDDVLVLNTPEYQVRASPKLVLVAEPKAKLIAIDGSVNIPKARIEPLDLSTVQTLPDTVHIKGQEQADSPWKVYLRSKVILGKDVLLSYQGLKAGLDGSITVTHEPGQLMLGVGKLFVTQGFYKAYGHKIDINHGELTFTGGPITNPGLNILATRTLEVSNAGQALDSSESEVQVGFKVQGDANNPNLKLYSSPSLSSQDILSYLVFGQPSTRLSDSNSAMLMQAIKAVGLTGHSVLDSLKNNFGLTRFGVESKRFYNPQTQTNEQTSAFVLGKQLSDRLSVNVSVGLLDPITILKIEYDISKRLSLTSEASPYGTGADLMYTIETD